MTVTARIAGVEAAGAVSGGMDWQIQYDDQTRAVTVAASGAGFCYVTVQVTPTITRTVAFKPAGAGDSENPDLASRMTAADFKVTTNGSTVVLASGINPNQVSRIVGKAGQVVGGLPSSGEYRLA